MQLRNIAIIAHVDHGKTTLVDALLQQSGTFHKNQAITDRAMDSNDLERERGITIKANSVRLSYKAKNGNEYILNLIDTPGHVDFSYEVSRSMRAVEGSLLVVDASQGVEAQTLANVYTALEADHEIFPILNKVDLPASDCDRVAQQIEEVIGLDASSALQISAKTGKGIDEVLEAIVTSLPPPKGTYNNPLKAMLIDSWYDSYLGVVVMIRIVDGALKKGDKIIMMQSGAKYTVDSVGVLKPKIQNVDNLSAGEIGVFTASIKQVRDTRVGDTITLEGRPCSEPLAGYEPAKPVVFCGFFPVDSSEFENLRESIEKLALNDSSFTFEIETSLALGFGFRCGFLGLLHLEVIRERIEREFNIDLITTAPSVVYSVETTDNKVLNIHNPADLPDASKITCIKEPRIKATILVPDEYLGDVLKLCQERRGVQKDLTYVGSRAMTIYDLPLNEVVFDFYDKLKSVTKGYASFDYQIEGYQEDNLVKMQILVNDEPVDALSMMVHRSKAESRGRSLCEKLKGLIPQHLFKVPIQAAIGGRVIARETISALRKDVTAKCYGGDITRKRKLLEKQKAGKKKMRQFGRVEIPQQAFIDALKMSD